MPRYRVGIDIGGTFTDFFVIDDEAQTSQILKMPSNATTPEQSVFDGLAHLFAGGQIKPGEIGYFTHGTTLAVNTILQRRGLRTALLVTEGFRDILNIGRHRIPDVFNFFTDVPDPLVSRALTFEVAERILADGTVYIPPDLPAMAGIAAELSANGVEAVAICFLHSYRNPANERAVRDALLQARPGLHITAVAATSGRKCASTSVRWRL